MSIETYVETIKGLHANWEPYPEQAMVGRALFNDGFKRIFAECGRNFGKTEVIAYCLWRWANLNPGSENYYFAPLAKQAREIVWSSNRIQSFGPRDWILRVNNTEMRIVLTNGSFIKLDGSDNIDAYRGVKPKGLSVYDEYKDFRPEFHDAYDPNLAAHDSPLIVIGTPPPNENHFMELGDEHKRDPLKAYFNFPGTCNPHIPKRIFEAKKEELYAKGEGDVWEREYMARRVKGGKQSIFPMLSRGEHLREHGEIVEKISRDKKKLRWATIADPGTATCFAVLFVAFNPYTRVVYCLDELYEQEQRNTTSDQMGRATLAKEAELGSGRADWERTCDEAALWFMNEVAVRLDMAFTPTAKSENKKEKGIGLIKDMLLANKLVLSSRCEKLFWEMENYIRDKNGNIPKENDHLIDCLRYAVASLAYSLNTEKEPVDAEWEARETKRFYTPDEDLRNEGLIDTFYDELDEVEW